MRIVYDKSSSEYLFTGIMYSSSDPVYSINPLLDLIFYIFLFTIALSILYRIFEYKVERIKQEKTVIFKIYETFNEMNPGLVGNKALDAEG